MVLQFIGNKKTRLNKNKKKIIITQINDVVLNTGLGLKTGLRPFLVKAV